MSSGGPASLLLAFILIGFVLYCTVQALGEMAVTFPVAGSFSAFATRFIDPAWGFAIGWNYALQWLFTVPLGSYLQKHKKGGSFRALELPRKLDVSNCVRRRPRDSSWLLGSHISTIYSSTNYIVEIMSAAITLEYWNSDMPKWAGITIFLAIIIAINLCGVKAYGEAEYFMSIVKVTAVIGFMSETPS